MSAVGRRIRHDVAMPAEFYEFGARVWNALNRENDTLLEEGRHWEIVDRALNAQRFLAKVLIGPGCWEWTGDSRPNGYGRFHVGGRGVLAHRYCYELLVGPIPEGLTLDHLCRNTKCVRPDHLEPVTQRENTLRGDTAPARNAVKTHCVHGHAFTPENTYLTPDGRRNCRACRNAATTRYHKRVRGAS